MKILYLRAADSAYDLPLSLQAMGHEVDSFDNYEFDLRPVPPAVASRLSDTLRVGTYDLAISYLFFDAVSDACQKTGIKYISWIYDSPLATLYHTSVHNPVNYLFVFDRREFERLSAEDLPHLYHLPMAANTLRTGQLSITPEDTAQYAHPVSFIGSLYTDNAFNLVAPYLPTALAEEAKARLLANICDWNVPKEWPYVSDDLLNFFVENTGFERSDAGEMDPRLYLGIAFYARKSAELDRLTVLNAISQLCPVDLYTSGKSDLLLPNVRVHPSVDYNTTTCKIYHLSKINLNITLPSIESGLPQRIYDIMSCGGFVLTNYQPEIEDLFEIGKEIEVFHDQTELLSKTEYYLTHEQERLSVAIRGYQKVCQYHTYTQRIETMLTTASK
jgi:spore maturation protein CgeB